MNIVRNNLLTQLHYTPYCGGDKCYLRWPRATFRGEQFGCACGWRSAFEPEFIEQYKAAQKALAAGPSPIPHPLPAQANDGGEHG